MRSKPWYAVLLVFFFGASAVGMAGAVGSPPPVDDSGLDSADDTFDHHQHGGTGGHLPASSENVRLVGKMRVNQPQPGRVTDVGVFNGFAYLGAYSEPNCQKGGVYVFDIHDPAHPKQINFIRTSNDSFVSEGVQVIHLDSPTFAGDVLAMNNEVCGENQHANGGLTLVDVTNPKVHKYLAEHAGDDDDGDGLANQIHSAFLWDAGERAYAVLVDDEEATDVDILDITDPRHPVILREYDLAAEFPQILQAGLPEVFLHDVVVKQIGDRWVMLLSYWDAGYVQLDVTDPANATYLADSDFTIPDPLAAERGLPDRFPEGNGHEAEFTLDNQYVIGADEDFAPASGSVANETDGTETRAGQGAPTPPVLPYGSGISGPTYFVGRACPGDAAPPPAPNEAGSQIAVVERGVCLFTEKVAAIEAAGGYEAIVIMNREGADACTGFFNPSVAGSTPTFLVPRDFGFALFDVPYDDTACRDATIELAPIAPGTQGDVATVRSIFDGWGYVHLFDGTTMAELDTYAIPEAHDPAFASGFGDLSVHEAATSLADDRLVYFSYYAGGFRVVRVVDGELTEVGHFIDQGGNNFWGVQVFKHDGHEYVAASDRDLGLYIFEYSGP